MAASQKKIELLREDRLRIGDRDFHVYYRPDDDDAEVYGIEAEDADEDHSPYRSKLSPHDLRGVRISDLPPGMALRIAYPRGYSPFDHVAWIRTVRAKEMRVFWSYSYRDWLYTLNLRHWADDFAQVLRRSARAVKIETSQDEYGTTFYASLALREDDECHRVLRQYSTEVQEAYRQAVRHLTSAASPRTQSTIEKAVDWQWWIKYVGVPSLVAVLGLVGAIVAAMIG